MAAEIENVIIAAGDCSLTLLPSLGGKIASLRVGEQELLQAPLVPYTLRNRTMDFSESDASGWDECLPSVAACDVETAAGVAVIPDHGDLWRVPWQVLDVTADSATMQANCFSLPLQLTRSMILSESASGWRLSLMYTVANLGRMAVPWAWSSHPLFCTHAGDRIVLPPTVDKVRLEGSGGGRISGARSGAVAWVEWPVATLTDGSRDDLSLAKAGDAESGDKLFAGPVEDGWCCLMRPATGLRLAIRFDAKATPYVGLWLCYGGWPESGRRKQVCVAIEPTTAPVDSLRKALNEPEQASRCLQPGETFSWPMELEIDRIDKIDTNAHIAKRSEAQPA